MLSKSFTRILPKALIRLAGCCVFLLGTAPSSLFAESPQATSHDQMPWPRKLAKNPEALKRGYTLNLENRPVIDYIKFISKIADVNFIYSEEDLNFNVTILSEEPTSLANIMSALLQMLKINNLSLIEDDLNFVIHTNPDIKQIPTVVSAEHPFTGERLPPMITRVFLLKNANPTRIASLITPMLSTGALIEPSPSTRQIIVSDLTTNIEKIGQLLLSLDRPQTPFDLAKYQSVNISPEDLVTVTEKILKPLTAGEDQIILIPQSATGSVYIVATPYLIERTKHLMADLDKPSSFFDKAHPISMQNILIYQLKYKSADAAEHSLKQIIQSAESQGFSSTDLSRVVDNMRVVRSTNSIMFVGPTRTLENIDGLLARIDLPSKSAGELENSSFYLYEPKYIPVRELESILTNIDKSFESSRFANSGLISTLKNMHVIDDIQSILFTGDRASIEEVKTLLASIEESYQSDDRKYGPIEIYIYRLVEATPAEIKQALDDVAGQLHKNDFANADIIKTIDSMHYVKESNALVFTGHAKSIEQIKEILPTLDRPAGLGASHTFPVVLKAADYAVVKQALDKYALTLPSSDPTVKMIEHMEWIPSSHMMLFHGSPVSMKRIMQVIELTDTEENAGANARAYKIIRLESASGKAVIEDLKNTAKHLKSTDSGNLELIRTLENAQWHPQSNSIFMTGNKDSLAEATDLVRTFDQGRQTPQGSARVFVYRLTHISPADLKVALHGIAEYSIESNPELKTSDLIHTIDSMRVIPDTNSVQFVGSPLAIEEIQQILKTLDTPDQANSSVKEKGGNAFLVYTPKNLSARTLLSHLQKFIAEVSKKGKGPDAGMRDTIETGKIGPENNKIIFHGSKKNLAELELLLHQLDTPESGEGGHSMRKSPEVYELYHPTHVKGPRLIHMVQQFQDQLLAAGIRNHDMNEVIDHLSYMEETGNILVTGKKVDVEEAVSLLTRFDSQAHLGSSSGDSNQIETIDDISFLQYKLQYHQGGEIVQALKKIGNEIAKSGQHSQQSLLDAISSIEWIQLTNSLMMSGNAQTLLKLEELIKSIDQPLRQVFIEVLVLETTVSNLLDFGLQWGSQGKYRDKFALGTGSFGIPATNTNEAQTFSTNLAAISGTRSPTGSDIPFFNAGSLGVIGDIILHKGQTYLSLGSLLKAVQNDGDITVTLSQKIIAQDNRNSKVFSGDNIPFTGSLVTTSGLSQTTNANLEYRNVGVTLSMTPYIGNGDIITLDIEEEISEEQNQGTNNDGTNSVTTQQVNGIRTSKTNMQTRVHVPDKHFVILSGMIRNSMTRTVTKIPCLGGLPAVGAAFSSTERVAEKKNIIIFVKPEIVEPFTDIYERITNRQEELFRSQASEEYFDEGLDVVKTPTGDEDDEEDDDEEDECD